MRFKAAFGKSPQEITIAATQIKHTSAAYPGVFRHMASLCGNRGCRNIDIRGDLRNDTSHYLAIVSRSNTREDRRRTLDPLSERARAWQNHIGDNEGMPMNPKRSADGPQCPSASRLGNHTHSMGMKLMSHVRFHRRNYSAITHAAARQRQKKDSSFASGQVRVGKHITGGQYGRTASASWVVSATNFMGEQWELAGCYGMLSRLEYRRSRLTPAARHCVNTYKSFQASGLCRPNN